jgi:hypothetical protein
MLAARILVCAAAYIRMQRSSFADGHSRLLCLLWLARDVLYLVFGATELKGLGIHEARSAKVILYLAERGTSLCTGAVCLSQRFLLTSNRAAAS